MTREELMSLCLMLGGKDANPSIEPPVYQFNQFGVVPNIECVVLWDPEEVQIVYRRTADTRIRTYYGAAQALLDDVGVKPSV